MKESWKNVVEGPRKSPEIFCKQENGNTGFNGCFPGDNDTCFYGSDVLQFSQPMVSEHYNVTHSV